MAGKKQKMRRICLIMLAAVSVLASASAAYAAETGSKVYTEGPLQYRISEDDTVSIIGYYGSAYEYTIPWSIGLRDVKSIEDGAFAGADVDKVNIPENDVSYEREKAFNDSQTVGSYDLSDVPGTALKTEPDSELTEKGEQIIPVWPIDPDKFAAEKDGIPANGTETVKRRESVQENELLSGVADASGNSPAAENEAEYIEAADENQVRAVSPGHRTGDGSGMEAGNGAVSGPGVVMEEALKTADAGEPENISVTVLDEGGFEEKDIKPDEEEWEESISPEQEAAAEAADKPAVEAAAAESAAEVPAQSAEGIKSETAGADGSGNKEVPVVLIIAGILAAGAAAVLFIRKRR